MRDNNQRGILDLWPVLQDDFRKFMSDRPGWFISALENAHNRKGNRGWKDVETVINILRFLKETEIEYY